MSSCSSSMAAARKEPSYLMSPSDVERDPSVPISKVPSFASKCGRTNETFVTTSGMTSLNVRVYLETLTPMKPSFESAIETIEKGLLTENLQACLILFNKYVKQHGKMSEALFYRGYSHFIVGRYQFALEDFNICLEMNYTNPLVYILKCLVLIKLKKYKESLNNIDQFIKKQKSTNDGLYLKHYLCYKLKQFSTLLSLSALPSDYPYKDLVTLMRAHSLRKKGRLSDSLSLLESGCNVY